MSQSEPQRTGCRRQLAGVSCGCFAGLLLGVVIGAVVGVWGWIEFEHEFVLDPLAEIPVTVGELTLDETKTYIDRLAESYLADANNVGLVVGIAADGESRVFGYGRLAKDSAQPPDGDTVFELASVGKTLTASVLADMHLAGELSWDDTLSSHLPEDVVVPGHGERPMTLLDLATQSSGLPSLPPDFEGADPLNPYADYTVERMYADLGRIQLPRAPGERYEYSNLGFGLLGHALSRRAGTDYESLVISRVCDPLGMSSTRMTLDESLRNRLATPHDGGRAVPVWEDTTMPGAGSFLSTANEMLLYLQAHWRAGPDAADRLAQAMWETTRKRRPGDASSRAIGMAWHIDSENALDIYWHNGGAGGSRSYAAFLREPEVAVVVLSNSGAPVDEIGYKLVYLLAWH